MAGNSEADLKSLRPVIRGSSEKAQASFAFGMASKAADSFLVADKSKAPKSLEGEAKKGAGAGAKVVSGKVYCDGTDAVFVTDDASSAVEKGLDAWLKLHKLGLSADVGKPEPAEEGEEDGPKIYATETLISRFRFAQRNPVNFAFGPGKEKDASLLALHVRRSGKMMFRGIKRENHAIRGAWGVLNMEGRIATFTCEEKPIPGLRKSIRGFLRGRDLRYRVKIFGPEGEVIEPGDEEEDAADLAADQGLPEETGTEGAAPGAPTEPQPTTTTTDDGVGTDAERLEKMRLDVQRMMDPLKEITQKVPSRKEAISALYTQFETARKAGQVGDAQGALDALREQGRTGRADVQALDTMRKQLADREKQLVDLAKSKPDIAAVIRTTYGECKKSLDAGDVATAREKIFELAGIMRTSGTADVPDGTVAYRQMLLRWNRAQTDVATNIQALGAAVLKHPEVLADARVAEVREAVRELPTLVPNFGSALQDALDAMINAGPEAKARGLIAPAATAVENYVKELAGYPELSELEEVAELVGEGNLKFGAALSEALTELQASLRAAA